MYCSSSPNCDSVSVKFFHFFSSIYMTHKITRIEAFSFNSIGLDSASNFNRNRTDQVCVTYIAVGMSILSEFNQQLLGLIFMKMIEIFQ
jgi:hypothetical protein